MISKPTTTTSNVPYYICKSLYILHRKEWYSSFRKGHVTACPVMLCTLCKPPKFHARPAAGGPPFDIVAFVHFPCPLFSMHYYHILVALFYPAQVTCVVLHCAFSSERGEHWGLSLCLLSSLLEATQAFLVGRPKRGSLSRLWPNLRLSPAPPRTHTSSSYS